MAVLFTHAQIKILVEKHESMLTACVKTRLPTDLERLKLTVTTYVLLALQVCIQQAGYA